MQGEGFKEDILTSKTLILLLCFFFTWHAAGWVHATEKNQFDKKNIGTELATTFSWSLGGGFTCDFGLEL